MSESNDELVEDLNEAVEEDDGSGAVGGALDAGSDLIEAKAHEAVEALQVLREKLEEQVHSGVSMGRDAGERVLSEVDDLIGRIFDITDEALDVVAK
jgi:hypothetical protein